ncbi:MAG: hypothetical protein LBI94_08570 [Treponema sp.]|nr:hypothetical protein [Treponema sp.]
MAKTPQAAEPSSLLHLYIFCIFMQKIFDKWAALAVCKVKIFTFVNIFTVLCAKRNKLLGGGPAPFSGPLHWTRAMLFLC